MYDTSKEMGFPYMAGSSLAVTWRIPSVEFHRRESQRGAVHLLRRRRQLRFSWLETLQCMVERRKGGESGVKWLQAYRGDKFWTRAATTSGRASS